MRKNIIRYKKRLIVAEKISLSDKFQNLVKHVNQPTYNFIPVKCQVHNQHVKIRARRYTIEEKILALSLFKNSGKGYCFLSKIFALPTPRTLSTLLQKIPFYPGINSHIFENMKCDIRNMRTPQDKVYVAMFDEIHLQANLTYERKQAEIFGLEDHGDDKKPILADYANVFMIRGAIRQWRQPITFTFSRGPIKAHKLKDKNDKKSYCGVSESRTGRANNQSAINLLLRETEEHHLRAGTANKNFCFVINGQEIVPLYDVPHLFKGAEAAC
nr:unnamed protein product [Callosobruchus analis]